MSAELVFVRVHDRGLFVTGGMVQRWHAGIVASVHGHVIEEVAKITRSGQLMGGIGADTSGAGTHFLTGTVSSSAPHTRYVLFGTAHQGQRYIYSNGGFANKAIVDQMARGKFYPGELTQGWWLKIDEGPSRRTGAYHRGPILRVHGQKANNFLLKGYNATARTHRSLHAITPRVI